MSESVHHWVFKPSEYAVYAIHVLAVDVKTHEKVTLRLNDLPPGIQTLGVHRNDVTLSVRDSDDVAKGKTLPMRRIVTE